MSKYHYLAAQTRENGKNYAFVIKFSESDNILSKLAQYKNIVFANMCSTKKEAAKIVTEWNDLCKANNTFLFDCPMF